MIELELHKELGIALKKMRVALMELREPKKTKKLLANIEKLRNDFDNRIMEDYQSTSTRELAKIYYGDV